MLCCGVRRRGSMDTLHYKCTDHRVNENSQFNDMTPINWTRFKEIVYQSLHWSVYATNMTKYFNDLFECVAFLRTSKLKHRAIMKYNDSLSWTEITNHYWNGALAPELHNSFDLSLLCWRWNGAMTGELHNSVNLNCGVMATELHNSVELFCDHKLWSFGSIQGQHIDCSLRVSLV